MGYKFSKPFIVLKVKMLNIWSIIDIIKPLLGSSVIQDNLWVLFNHLWLDELKKHFLSMEWNHTNVLKELQLIVDEKSKQ